METHSSILTWKIQSTGSHRVRHDKQLSMRAPAPPQRQLGGLTMTVDTTRVPWSCPLRCSTDFCSFLSHPGHSPMTRGWKLSEVQLSEMQKFLPRDRWGRCWLEFPNIKHPSTVQRGCPCLGLSLLSACFTVSLAGVSPVTCLACTAWHFGGGLPHPGEGTLVALHLPACFPTLLSNVPGIRRDTRARR